jgi:glyoxylase-like metal-dependent hydrolase (beta-lactamase superfamily II)
VLAAYPFSYERVKVAEGIYAFIDTPGHAVVSGTTVAIVGEEAVAVIDTGHHPRLTRRIIEEIRALTPKPVAYVVNTHWHNDHVSGNGLYVDAFPGAKVVAHAFTSTLLERDVRAFQGPNCAPFLKAQSKGLRELVASGKGGDGTPLTDARRKRMQGFLDDADAAIEECAEFRFRGADLTFNDRITLRLGSREVELLHLGRANTAGDIVAWIPDAKVLAVGDLVVHPFPFATQSYIGEWAAVLRKVEAMPFEALIPGHGPVMRDRRYLAQVAETLESIMAQARAAYRPGMAEAQLRKHVDLARFRREIAGDDAFIGANFDYMMGQLAVRRAWEELRGRFEPEALQQ